MENFECVNFLEFCHTSKVLLSSPYLMIIDLHLLFLLKIIISITPAGDLYTKSFNWICKKTRSHNVNHSFRIFKMVFSYWLVGLFVSVRPVVALIRFFCLLLTNECLLLTHITSHPRGSRWTPFEGPSRPRVIIINSYNPLHFVYSI